MSLATVILILGLLYLATSKAGLKVLVVVAVVIAVGGGGFIYWVQRRDERDRAQWAANRASGACDRPNQTAQEEVDMGCFMKAR